MINHEISDDSQYVEHTGDCDIPMDVFTAASFGYLPFFQEIYNRKNDSPELSSANQSGWTPIMYACSRGHSSLVYYLLQLGITRKCKSKDGVTPLMLAISSGDVSTVENIFDASDLEERDCRHWTALFYAIYFTREKCAQFLLSKGANVNIVDYQNETPLIIALKSGREHLIRLLLKESENLNVVSYKNESALTLAKSLQNLRIEKLIQEKFDNMYKSPISNFHSPNILNHSTVDSFMKKRFLLPNQNAVCTPSPLRSVRKRLFQSFRTGKSLSYCVNDAEKQSHDLKNSPRPVQNAMSTGRFLSPKPITAQGVSVESFLKNLGLEKYWSIFKEEEVDFETLLTLSEENLKEVGILPFGPRRKIYLAIQHFRRQFYA